MSVYGINWNRIALILLIAILTAFFIGVIWIFTDIWLPYQVSRRNSENIKKYIQEHRIYEQYPSLKNDGTTDY